MKNNIPNPCLLCSMDTTGTQKANDELSFKNVGIAVDGINFAWDKEALHNSLSQAVTSHEICWPVVRGIQRQMASYTRENDKKIAQDIVMTLAKLAFLERHAPEVDPSFTPSQKSNTYDIRRRTTIVGRR